MSWSEWIFIIKTIVNFLTSDSKTLWSSLTNSPILISWRQTDIFPVIQRYLTMADRWTSDKNRVVYRMCGYITDSKLNYDREIIYAPNDLWLNYWRLIFLVLKRNFTDKMWSDSILTQLFLFLLQIYISSRYRLFSRYQYQSGLKSHWSIPGSCWALAKSWCFSHFGVFFSRFCWHWGNRENIEYHLISF